MSSIEPDPPRYHYYLVEPGSGTMEMMEQFEDDCLHRRQEWNRLIKQYKAKGYYASGGHLLGLVFDFPRHTPQGFRLKQGTRNIYVPDLRGKLGRDIFQQFEDAFIPGSREFTHHMGGLPVQTGWHGVTPQYTDFHWEAIDNWIVLVVPRTLSGAPGWPPPRDVKPLLASQYWRHREQAGLA